jgi:hypothetical protein
MGSLVSIPVGLASFLIIPGSSQRDSRERGRWKRLDLVGAGSFTGMSIEKDCQSESTAHHCMRELTSVLQLRALFQLVSS